MTHFIVKPPKPRNPFVAAAHFRCAGRHGPKAGAARQAGRRALKQELSRLDPRLSARGKPPTTET